MGHPSVYPTGTTLYSKDKAFNGYTNFSSARPTSSAYDSERVTRRRRFVALWI